MPTPFVCANLLVSNEVIRNKIWFNGVENPLNYCTRNIIFNSRPWEQLNLVSSQIWIQVDEVLANKVVSSCIDHNKEIIVFFWSKLKICVPFPGSEVPQPEQILEEKE